MSVALKALPAAVVAEATDPAQRHLLSALDTIEGVLRARTVVRKESRDAGKSAVGAPTAVEADLYRAAIVFAGAGLDATLKQLVRFALSDLLLISEEAERNFEKFVVRTLSQGSDEVRPGPLAKLLISSSPREELLSSYLYDLTGSSLQSTEEVHRTVAAFGIKDPSLTKEIKALQTLFEVRNQIVHELDLVHVREKGDRTRRTRRLATTEELCFASLKVGQLIINEVAKLLGGVPTASAATPAKKSSAKKTPAKKSSAKKTAAKKAPAASAGGSAAAEAPSSS